MWNDELVEEIDDLFEQWYEVDTILMNFGGGEGEMIAEYDDEDGFGGAEAEMKVEDDI